VSRFPRRSRHEIAVRTAPVLAGERLAGGVYSAYYGTLLARKGLAPYEIAAMMGHKDGGKLAMERYIHVTERDARDKVAAAFGSNVR
jgi:hypothetical protein